jgi:hypothetical protein
MRALCFLAIIASVVRATPCAAQQTFTVSGRVVTSSGSPAHNILIMVGPQEGTSLSEPIPNLREDGTFVASQLPPGRYVIYAGPGLEPSAPGTEAGYVVVTVRGDVDGVEIRMQPSHAVRGRVRFDAADQAASHPKVSVTAIVAGDDSGLGMIPVRAAQAQPDGSFVIDNVVGSVVLRSGYQSPDDGSRWWAGPVLLDDRDITNVPTDFSKEAGEIELVLTQRPTAVFGVVVEDATQLPAEDVSVVVFSEDPAQRQLWATSSQMLTTDSNGRFWQTLSPGRYRAVAFPAGTFSTPGEAFRNINAFEKLATPFTIDPERRGARVRLTLSRPPLLRR